MTEAERDRRSRPMPRSLLALLVLLGVVVAGAVVWGPTHEQDDLTARAQLALAQAGYDGVAVQFDGRDATIAGDVETDADATAVEDLVYRLRGVRRVDVSGLALAPAAADPATEDRASDTAAPAPAHVVIEVDGGMATLRGVVPTHAAADAAVTAAAAVFGAGKVVGAVAVDVDAGQSDWLGFLSEIVTSLEGLETGSVRIGDGKVVLAGMLADAESADAIAGAVAAATSLDVVNQFQVLGAAAFAASAEGDAITLSGTLPEPADVAAAVEGAEAHYGSVDNQLTAGGVRRSSWVDQLPALFPAMEGWASWNVELGEQGGVFDGFASTIGAPASLRDGFLAGLAITSLDFRGEVLPEVVAADITALIEGSATFQAGSARLSSEATALLDEVVIVLRANPATSLIVEGHTDDRGNAGSNLRLSQDRAQAVVDYLVAGGVDAFRLTAVGLGEDRPIADNDTAEGREQNRRIEFVVNREGDG